MDNRITILLVDDDEDDRTLFCKSVTEVDPEIECIPMEDALHALKYLKDSTNKLPSFIFLDLRMPKMNGRKCLEEIRADDRLKELPVIIYSTSDDIEDAKSLSASGATHFVTKPANPSEIYYLLSMVLSEKWS